MKALSPENISHVIKKEFDFMLMEPDMRILEIEDDNRKQIKQAERKYELPVWL